METIICNDFSLDMVHHDCNVDIRKLSLRDFEIIYKTDEFSTCINDEHVAKDFNLPLGKGEILLEENTRLIVIKPSQWKNSYIYRIYCIENKGVLNE